MRNRAKGGKPVSPHHPLRILGVSPGRNSMDGLPPWARVTAVVGIPGLIAIYLVYVLATGLPAKLDAHARESTAEATKIRQLLKQICVNTADTPEARSACWNVDR